MVLLKEAKEMFTETRVK